MHSKLYRLLFELILLLSTVICGLYLYRGNGRYEALLLKYQMLQAVEQDIASLSSLQRTKACIHTMVHNQNNKTVQLGLSILHSIGHWNQANLKVLDDTDIAVAESEHIKQNDQT